MYGRTRQQPTQSRVERMNEVVAAATRVAGKRAWMGSGVGLVLG